jgi:hypothetical protein
MYLLAAVVSGVCTWVPAAAQEISAVASSSAVSAALTPFEANSPASSELVAPATPGSESLLLSVRAGMRISPVMQAKIPLRVHSMDGIPGDVVNFLFIGNEHDMKKAMDRAGWNTVACTKLGVIWRDLFASLYIKSYRGIPMTKLYLFGRQQDYGFAHSRGLLSVRNRHHFRIWLAPFQVDGQSLWIGAGTHDVALHYVGRFLHFIHKIDPNVDAERQSSRRIAAPCRRRAPDRSTATTRRR